MSDRIPPGVIDLATRIIDAATSSGRDVVYLCFNGSQRVDVMLDPEPTELEARELLAAFAGAELVDPVIGRGGRHRTPAATAGVVDDAGVRYTLWVEP